MANNQFKLKNFRVFDQKGAEFEIAPLTVLTGCNSSGKSSAIKSLMLLNKYFNTLKEDYIGGKPISMNDYELLFNKGKHNLGTYQKTLSKYSKTRDMSFSWKTYSPLLFDEIDVEICFSENNKNILNNAVINEVRIVHKNKTILVLNFKEKFSIQIDFKTFKERFILFARFVKYYYGLIDRLGEDDDGIPNKLKNEDVLSDPQYGINAPVIEHIVYAIQNLKKRDGVETLISKCNELPLNFDVLFTLPVLEWLKEVKKNDVEKVILKKLQESDSELITISDSLKVVLDEFVASKHKTFKDFYEGSENEFLKSLSQKPLLLPIVFGNDDFHIFKLINRSLSLNPLFCSHKLDLLRFYAADEERELHNSLDSFEFSDAHEKFMILADLCTLDKDFMENRIGHGDPMNGPMMYIKTKEVDVATQYLNAVIQDLIFNAPPFIQNIDFVEAVRANAQRIYSFNSIGGDFNELILSYLNSVSKYKKGDWLKRHELGSFMRKWLKSFEIADDVIFENTLEGLGVLIYLIKGDAKELLADQGYGITQLLAIMLKIETIILKSEFEHQHPLVSMSVIRYRESTISIEEPETNLHPKFQSLMAEMLVDAYKTYNIRFIIETHSEYLIRKLQILVAKKEINADAVSLNYIYHHDKAKRPAGKPQVLNIKIKEDGRLSEPFGSGFFDEADNLALDLLTLKTLN